VAEWGGDDARPEPILLLFMIALNALTPAVSVARGPAVAAPLGALAEAPAWPLAVWLVFAAEARTELATID
jgi:hypothetical protein